MHASDWLTSISNSVYHILGWEIPDQTPTRNETLKSLFLSCIEAQLCIVRHLGHRPGAYFRTCKKLYAVKSIFMQIEQSYVWSRLRAHAYANDECDSEAVQRYMVQSGLNSLKEVYEINLDGFSGEQKIVESLGLVPACERLTIRQAWRLQRASAALLAQKCTTVQHLHLYHGIQAPLYPLAQHCHNLRTLTLSGWNIINSDHLLVIAKQCLELCHIQLKRCIGITDRDIATLTATCKNLSSLGIIRCDGITDKALTIISENCPGLTEVDIHISSNDPTGLMKLVDGCPQLKKMRLRHYWLLSNDTLDFLADRCQALMELHLPCWCLQASSDALERLMQKLCHLTHITLSQSSKITDRVVSALALHHPNLQKIGLHRCEGITDAGMIAVAESCPKLVGVVCRMNDVISDKTLFALAESCPHLAKLDLRSCTVITDAGIVNVAEKCHRLCYLNVTHAPRITKTGIEKIWMLRPYCDVFHTTVSSEHERACTTLL